MKKSLKKAKKIKKLVPPPPDEGAMEIPDFLVRDKDNVPQTKTILKIGRTENSEEKPRHQRSRNSYPRS